ncbi:hypothetical protein [Lactobacillus intestinalis]|uniref:hypothetical protein n=1 Tax=Lactobacillus intestinalis TaxID=151781 RepID=UPI0025A99C26|nr:hypothetical protein [Lactobacillus intestinalis]
MTQALNTAILVTDSDYFIIQTTKNANCLAFPLTLSINGHKQIINREEVTRYFFNNTVGHKLTCYERGNASCPFTVDSTNAKIKDALNETIAQII